MPDIRWLVERIKDESDGNSIPVAYEKNGDDYIIFSVMPKNADRKAFLRGEYPDTIVVYSIEEDKFHNLFDPYLKLSKRTYRTNYIFPEAEILLKK